MIPRPSAGHLDTRAQVVRCGADHLPVTSSFIKRVARAVGWRLVAVVVAIPAAVAAAGSSEADQLIVADPLPGYVVADGGSLNGPIDVGTLMQLEGTDAADVPDVFHEFRGLRGGRGTTPMGWRLWSC